MIFHKDKIIFFHPGKTGGTSIEVALTKRNLEKEFGQLNSHNADYNIMYGFCKKHKIFLHHADIRFYTTNNIDIPKDYLKITSIRRPYDKVLSAYFYNGWDKKYTFHDFIVKKIEFLIARNKDFAINHFCPQIHYINQGYELIQLENIAQDCDKLGIEISPKKHAQTKANKIYKDYLSAYDTKTKDIIRSVYKEDFVTFSYDY